MRRWAVLRVKSGERYSKSPTSPTKTKARWRHGSAWVRPSSSTRRTAWPQIGQWGLGGVPPNGYSTEASWGFDADFIGSSSCGPRPGGRVRRRGCGAGMDRWCPLAGGEVGYLFSGAVSLARGTSISGTQGPEAFFPHSLVR